MEMKMGGGGYWATGGRDGEEGGVSSEGQNLSSFLKANRIFHPCKVKRFTKSSLTLML